MTRTPLRILISRAALMSAAACLLVATGCDDPQIETVTVPKGSETLTQSAPTNQMPNDDVHAGVAAPDDHAGHNHEGHDHAAHQQQEELWTLPQGWTVSNEQRPMRYATFIINTDADGPVEVAVTQFGGDVGGKLANVNRWRRQLGMTPVTQEALNELLTLFSHPGFDGYQIHLEGDQQDMLAAGIYEKAHDRTWFVRVTAPHAVAQRIKKEVFDFAHSFGAPDAAALE